ncbi:uncharacterized protein LOC121111175 isoform X4 [Gallus gallus]|uniref:uncharacterized protein LOC121111175 isoform X4 n=1 Tax=Gallus gallus TaxID=9031 RepID=UPI001F003F65|nr:uncharacterized protein LOC121111175 isoform X4 [Gallus gallus]
MQRIPLVTARNKVANFCLFKEFLLDVTCSCSGLIIPALCRKKKEQWKRHSHSARQTIDVALVWANGLPELLWSSDGLMSFRYLCLQQCCSAFVEGPHTNDEVGCDILPTSL